MDVDSATRLPTCFGEDALRRLIRSPARGVLLLDTLGESVRVSDVLGDNTDSVTGISTDAPGDRGIAPLGNRCDVGDKSTGAANAAATVGRGVGGVVAADMVWGLTAADTTGGVVAADLGSDDVFNNGCPKEAVGAYWLLLGDVAAFGSTLVIGDGVGDSWRLTAVASLTVGASGTGVLPPTTTIGRTAPQLRQNAVSGMKGLPHEHTFASVSVRSCTVRDIPASVWGSWRATVSFRSTLKPDVGERFGEVAGRTWLPKRDGELLSTRFVTTDGELCDTGGVRETIEVSGTG